MLFAGATSEAQLDALIMHFQATTGVELVPVTPQTAPLKRRGRSVKDLDAASFSADCSDEEVADDIGLDFLTWLWFFSEMRGGELRLGQGTFAVSVEGPLTLVMEGGGAHEARLRNGAPLVSMEAKTALTSGKKLCRARVHIVRGEQEWIAELDGHEFVIRGLKLPKGEPLDAISRFQERMLSLRLFLDALLGFYDSFVEERIDASTWGTTLKDMRKWVASRAAKR
jgi:recombination associated protein RdgC